ncbi:hypothetical protein I4U23_020629 [Adineta vaga]|nr:hypothetical protein I4U23_020629 [Adineta vaga]
MNNNVDEIELEKRWHDKFPSILSGLSAFYLCLCTVAIIGCELGSVLIDQFNSTIYVGFWSSLFFIVAWILQGLAVSRCRTRQCATYTLIFQCISLVFAACIIGFDAYFLVYPTTCFFPISSCNSNGTSRGIFYSKRNFNDIKIVLIKTQLAIAAVMLAFFIAYIIMYTVTRMRLKTNKQSISKDLNKSKTILINDTNDAVSERTTYVLTTTENIMKSLSPSTTDIDVTTKSDDIQSTVPTKITDLVVTDVDEKIMEFQPTSTENHSTKNVLLTETTYVVSTNEQIEKSVPSSTTCTNISTKKTHTVTTNRNVGKPLSSSSSNIRSNVVINNRNTTNRIPTVQKTHGLTTEKSITKSLSRSTTRSNIPAKDRITRNKVSSTAAETHTWDVNKNTTKSLPSSIIDVNISTKIDDKKPIISPKFTQFNVVNVDKTVTESFSSSTFDMNISSWNNNTKSVRSTKPTPIHIWDTDENGIKNVSPSETDMNVLAWMNHTTNSVISKTMDTDTSITHEKILSNINMPTLTLTNTTTQTSFSESPYRSRWSINSDNSLPVEL